MSELYARFFMTILYFVAYLSLLSPLFSLVLSFRLKKSPFDIRLVQLLVAASFIIDLISYFLGRQGHNTLPLGNLYFLIQSLILLLIFCDALKIKRFSLHFTLVYGISFLINYFFIQSPYILNSYSHTISSIIFTLFALLYFRYLLVKLPAAFAYQIPMVWINLAVLVYYSGNLFLFALSNYFIGELKGYEGTIWIIHNCLNISKNILLMIAIWQSLRRTTSSSS